MDRSNHESQPVDDWQRDIPALAIAVLIAALAIALGRHELLVLLPMAPIIWMGCRSPQLSTAFVVFVIYTNAAVVMVRFHGMPSLLAITAPAPLLFALYEHLIRRRAAIVITATLPWIVIFLLLQTVSFLFAQNPAEAWTAMKISLMEGFVLYLLVTNVTRDRKLLGSLVWALAAAGALMGSLSLWQWSTRTYDNDYGGFAQTSEGLGVGIETSRGTQHHPRLCGPIGEKNRYGQVMAVLLPLLYCFSVAESRQHRRWLWLGALGLVAAGCILTYSRGTLVAVAMVGVAMVCTRTVKPRDSLLAIGLIVCVGLFSPAVQKRIVSIPRALGIFKRVGTEASEPDGAVKGRLTAMLSAARVFAAHPVLGVGPGQFRRYSRQYSREGGLRSLTEEREAHCLYLEIAAENGLLGLLAFLGMVASSVNSLRRRRREYIANGNEAEAMRVSGFLFALLAYLATALFLHLSYARYFWLILALVDSAARPLPECDTSSTTPATSSDGGYLMAGASQ